MLCYNLDNRESVDDDMKKALKIILIILLLGALGFEGWFLLRKKSKTPEEKQKAEEKVAEVIDVDSSKYLVNVESKYKKNDLSFKLENTDVYYYVQIDGLKNKDVQDKINKTIKERTLKIDKAELDEIHYGDEDSYQYKNIVGIDYSSFANTLSVIIGYTQNPEPKIENKILGLVVDAVNFDLNTGEEIKLTDVITSPDVLREELSSSTYHELYVRIGIVCYGGPCENPHPHYERVEDGLMSVLNQFNTGSYKFYFNEKFITLVFPNSYINEPFLTSVSKKDKEYNTIKKSCDKMDYGDDDEDYYEDEEYEDEYDDYEDFVCNDNYSKVYSMIFHMYDYLDNITVYNKYLSDESLFEKNNEKEIDVFTSNEFESSLVYEDGDNLYDFSQDSWKASNKIYEKAKELVIKESKSLKTEGKNIWSFESCDLYVYEYYVCFVVNHYTVPDNEYDAVRKQVYAHRNDSGYDENRLDYLKAYKPKDAYFYYVFDEKGNSIKTKEIFNMNFNWEKVIPESWIKKGKYKSAKDMLNSAYVITDEKYKFKNRLVIYVIEIAEEDYYDYEYKLYYNGETVTLTDDDFGEEYSIFIE